MRKKQELIMAKRSRRNHSPAFKAKVALAAIKSLKPLPNCLKDIVKPGVWAIESSGDLVIRFDFFITTDWPLLINELPTRIIAD